MKLINKLLSTRSTLQKEIILKYANEQEKKVLYYTYNPHLRFGIANIPALNVSDEPGEELFELLDSLANREITGDQARIKVLEYSKKHGDLIHLICSKDLNCGVSTKTINKVFNNLIPQFNIQLAKEVPLKELKYPLIAQIKYDGVRVIARVEKGKCDLLTRNGKLINFPYLSRVLADHIKEGTILDGELTIAEGKISDRTGISGKVNSAIHGGELSKEGVIFNVFDILTVKEFDNCECKLEYIDRMVELSNTVSRIYGTSVRQAEAIEVLSEKEANDYYTQVSCLGYEGIILKSANHKYSFKRSKDWIKVKAIKSADIKCIGAVPGKKGTKYENCIGSLECSGVVEGRQVIVSVGSGLSDCDRSKDISFYTNKTIEIKYNEVIPNSESNGYTLFLPRFVTVRLDK